MNQRETNHFLYLANRKITGWGIIYFSQFPVKHHEISFLRGYCTQEVRSANESRRQGAISATNDSHFNDAHTARTVINYEAAGFRVLLRPRVAPCRVSLGLSTATTTTTVPFSSLPSSLSCPPSWTVHCFIVFIFYFCPFIDIVMARYNFVTFDVLYCLRMVELKRKIIDRLDSLYQ